MDGRAERERERERVVGQKPPLETSIFVESRDKTRELLRIALLPGGAKF